MWFWVAVVIVSMLVLTGATGWLQRRTYFLQYFFFLRFPLLLTIGLIVLGVAGGRGDSFIRNVFVLDRPLHHAIVGLLATLAAWVVMYTTLLMWTRLPARTGLFFLKTRQKKNQKNLDKKLGGEISHEDVENPLWAPLQGVWRRMWMFAVLALPVVGACLYNSAPEAAADGHTWLNVSSALAGILGAALLIWVAISAKKWLERRRGKLGRLAPFLSRIETIPPWFDRVVFGYNEETDGVNGFEQEGAVLHRNAAYYLLVTLIVYGLAGCLSRPSIQPGSEIPLVPALAYVLLLLIPLGWLLSLTSFFFDKYRLPPELVLVFIVAGVYAALGADHYYVTHPIRDEARLRPVSTNSYLESLPKDLPIVVVAASGGGITASQWTATVLTQLQDNPELGSEFARSIRLISATSGGSVGAMYYVDTFDPDASSAHLKQVRQRAGRSSLSAMGWGLVYPDFWRSLGWPVSLYDRGWALETRWSEWLSPSLTGDERTLSRMPRLGDWRERVRKHEIPAVAFNATLVESGERLILTSLDRFSNEDPRTRGFQRFSQLYPDRDIEIASAARLSATFPWVTPVARPKHDDSNLAYHVADGGYYDNYGVMVAVQFIDELLRTQAGSDATTQIDRNIILIEIRASDSDQYDDARLDAGFYFELLGPAEALYSVRSASQRARNELELRLLRDRWPDRIERFTFELDPPFPLSWHLSASERAEINTYWDDPASKRERSRLEEHWTRLLQASSHSR